MTQFRYFMIRVRDDDRETLTDSPLVGVVERLGTGEKRQFASAEELTRLVATWTEATPIASPPEQSDA